MKGILGKQTFRSIRGRIVMIYFLLVFIALAITGVFIINQLENYMMNDVRSNLTKVVQDNILTFQEYDDLKENQQSIQDNLLAWAGSIQEEMFIVDDTFQTLAATNENYIGKSGLDLLGQNLLVQGLAGSVAEEDEQLQSGIFVKTMVFPIENEKDVLGVFCVQADISNIYNTRSQSIRILLKAMFLALAVTMALGFFIARSITVPINDVTLKAERMAQGDFSQKVSVKSEDEIGRLAEMFNLLREKLDETLSEMSNEKEKLETIIKQMADGLFAIDMEGRIILANSAAVTMLGLGETSVKGAEYEKILGTRSTVLSFEHIKEACAEGGASEIFEDGGKIFAVRYDRFGEEGAPETGIILLLQDITEQQQLEKMQRDFVANVSHELKTPLTTIKSYTETLLDGAMEERETAKQFLGVVDEEAERMAHLVKELLQLSRLDYKQEKWFMKEINLTAVLRSSAAKIEKMAKDKNQIILEEFDQERSLSVDADKERIEQVLLNFLSNAVKYSPEGKTIRIRAGEENGMACVEIRDEGIGIPEEDLPRVFERFYRVDKARSREMGGTGLGLAIAKQILENHRGTVELRSRLGEGTTVVMKLPLAFDRGMRNIE